MPESPIGEGEEELLQPAIDERQNSGHELVWPPDKNDAVGGNGRGAMTNVRSTVKNQAH